MTIAAGPTATRAEKIDEALEAARKALLTAQAQLNLAAELAADDYGDNAQRPADLAAALRVVAGQVAVEQGNWMTYAAARRR